MCGIAGIIDFRGRPVDRRVLDSFCQSLAHRGPDDRGTWVHEADGFSVGFAHTRLAVIDPTPEGHQPMLDATGRFGLTYNGELYNYLDLKKKLPGHWRTHCDTEVFLRACSDWGPESLQQFDGMWAAAFVDTQNRAGHLSRDPFGIKPLFYAIDNVRLVFASELATLRLGIDSPLEIDAQAVSLYLMLGFIPSPRTIYQNVFKLSPGHRLDFTAGGPRAPQRFFVLPGPPATDLPDSDSSSTPYREACADVRGMVQAAVDRQRVADVPLGAFLSGGLDSSIVTACLASASSSPIQTFSIGYADQDRYDETRYARLVADRFRTDHHAFRLTFGEVIDAIEPALCQLGEPFADSSLLPTMLVSQYTRRHVTVALSGDGGDELFGGYWRYLAHDYLDRYLKLPRLLRRGAIEPLLRLAPSARSTRILDRVRQARKLLLGADAPDAIARHLAWILRLGPAAALMGSQRASDAARQIDAALRYAASDIAGQGKFAAAPPFCITDADSKFHRPSNLHDVLMADLAVTLPDDMLFKVDTASMMHNLEVRVPLLDRDLVGFVSTLPMAYKIQGGIGKRVLRDAFASDLPADVLRRPKMGFEVPVGEFLRSGLRDMYHSVVTDEALAAFNLNAAAARRAYDEHLHRREDHGEFLWSLLVLCHWRTRS